MKKSRFLKKLFFTLLTAGTLCISALPAAARPYSQEELEQAISRIRSWYYSPTPEVQDVYIPGGEDGWEYNSEYYFHNGKLFFAFLYLPGNQQRFYYDNDELIRYIDADGNVYDYGNLQGYEIWGMRVLNEAYSYAGNPSAQQEDQSTANVFSIENCVGCYESGYDRILLVQFPGENNFFVIRLDGEGKLIDGDFRKTWHNNDNEREFWFVSGDETHTYSIMDFSGPEGTMTLNINDVYTQYYQRNAPYSSREIEILAKLHRFHYNAENKVQAEGIDQKGRVVVHIYEDVGGSGNTGHTATLDWYYVNPGTLETEDFLGNKFVLNILE